jgi:acid stress-induced BolA-like protein IbaG/YrbA
VSSHPTQFQGSVIDALREAIERQIPGARADVSGGDGHYSLVVTSTAFSGKGMLESQRLVYSAIAHLMKGDGAPVHAIESLKTLTPSSPAAPHGE